MMNSNKALLWIFTFTVGFEFHDSMTIVEDNDYCRSYITE